MKLAKLSLKWKLFTYLCGFVGVLLLILWLMQTVFLNDFYKYIKVKEMKSIASEIETNISHDDIGEYLIALAMKYNVCMLVSDGSGYPLFTAEVAMGCPIEKISVNQLKSYIIQALVNHGSYLQEITNLSSTKFNGFTLIDQNPRTTVDGMIYTKIIQSDNHSYAIILNAMITPVEATIRTIRIQLVYLTFVMIVFALFLALFLSKWLADPIGRISQSSKILAKGQYDIRFDETGYQEITELADSLNYAAKELGKVDALQKELIANISHDLRTPLTMITGYSEVMRDIPGENTKENIQIVIDEARRLTSLVNDVLDISRLQSNTQKLNLSNFNLTQLLRNIINRYKTLSISQGYELVFQYDQDYMVEGDEIKLTQVIYNLLNNAITYGGEHPIITIKQSCSNQGLLLEIIDTGEGIPQDQLQDIWNRYYKIDNKHKRPQLGSGLGLSIVKGILELHHAEFGVHSIENEGSTFWFALPILEETSL